MIYYLNARYYDSVTARFISEDTYTGEKNDPLTLNLYTYCSNNSITYDDPSGHKKETKVVATAVPMPMPMPIELPSLPMPYAPDVSLKDLGKDLGKLFLSVFGLKYSNSPITNGTKDNPNPAPANTSKKSTTTVVSKNTTVTTTASTKTTTSTKNNPAPGNPPAQAQSTAGSASPSGGNNNKKDDKNNKEDSNPKISKKAEEHVIENHGPNSTILNKSKFDNDFDIIKGINNALTNTNSTNTPTTNGRSIIEYTYKNPIGTNSNGKLINTIRVIVDALSRVITAYPVK